MRVREKRSHVDLVPTMMDLMGLPKAPEGELSGVSLIADIVQGGPESGGEARHEERDVYIDMPAGPNNSMHRALIFGATPGKKLIHFGAKNYSLYDLTSDPEEAHDLSSDAALLEVRTSWHRPPGRAAPPRTSYPRRCRLHGVAPHHTHLDRST